MPQSGVSTHFVVVAIDFGTTYSGYAFSFTRDPESIHMMRRWEGGDPGIVNQKTPTTLLLLPDGKFHSFGFAARDFYHDLDPQEAKKWLYFEKFKMTLHHNADLNKETTIKASNGKTHPALSVFSHALTFFKDHALQELSDQSSTTILNEDIRWVITVPAIWKAPAKQFMRQAAYQAGIASADNPNQLLIALEPEAASIYVRKLRLYQLMPDPMMTQLLTKREPTPDPSINRDPTSDDEFTSVDSVKYKTLPSSVSYRHSMSPSSTTASVGQEVEIEGTNYMVVDCGGGTVDITVYEMESGFGHLKELHKATGGPYGSLGIDLEFEKLLIGIFGNEFIEAFRTKRPAGWVDLLIAFESRKRTASPFKNNPLNVSLPFSFIDYYKKYKGSQVENAIRKYGNKEVTWSSQGMLRLTPTAMRRLFQPTLDHIKQAIGDVLNNPSTRDIKYMFLVGGFAESAILQMEMRKEFEHLLRILIPQDVGLTILKGAVCFGLDPTIVSVRRSRMTYGVGVLNRFVPDKHPRSKMITKDGAQWCTDVFDKFVEVDQSVAVGETVVRSYAPAKAGQKSTIIHIYSSEKINPQYISDPGVKRCGTLCLDLTDVQYRHSQKPRRREIQARMTFGDTEIKVTALDVATGKCVRAAIDFMNK